ncbi:hypothetical protein Patl1_00558 [Pistacia atlantica]|uniref:Uncharacterized protein n=1 Tax=Pistacia atlantica TaxID=434234 RepID=A0ACC1CCR1_9ROSI|nr:hypothetical protein Patl1_00558 [Pistacia atlantica]
MEVIMSRAFFCFLAVLAIFLAIISPSVDAQSMAPAPSPTSDDLEFSCFLLSRDRSRVLFVIPPTDFCRSRNCVRPDAGGSGAYIPHPPTRRIFLQLLLNFCLEA